jgi:hypothetical protein
VSRPVRQALALNTLESLCRPFPIGDTKAGTIAVAEIKLRKVALLGEGKKKRTRWQKPELRAQPAAAGICRALTTGRGIFFALFWRLEYKPARIA